MAVHEAREDPALRARHTASDLLSKGSEEMSAFLLKVSKVRTLDLSSAWLCNRLANWFLACDIT